MGKFTKLLSASLAVLLLAGCFDEKPKEYSHSDYEKAIAAFYKAKKADNPLPDPNLETTIETEASDSREAAIDSFKNDPVVQAGNESPAQQKAMNCLQNVSSSGSADMLRECEEARRELKKEAEENPQNDNLQQQSDSFDQFMSFVLMAAALAFMASGDLATGMMLLQMSMASTDSAGETPSERAPIVQGESTAEALPAGYQTVGGNAVDGFTVGIKTDGSSVQIKRGGLSYELEIPSAIRARVKAGMEGGCNNLSIQTSESGAFGAIQLGSTFATPSCPDWNLVQDPSNPGRVIEENNAQ